MGIDLYAESGIIADLDSALQFIADSNKEAVIRICQEVYNKLKADTEERPDSEWAKQTLEFFQPLATLNDKTTEEIKQILRDLFVIEPDECDPYIHHSEILLDIWEEIVKSRDKKLPRLKEIVYYASHKASGDMPRQEVCFVFYKDGCYKKALSEKGKRLKNIIGHCHESTWAIYSV